MRYSPKHVAKAIVAFCAGAAGALATAAAENEVTGTELTIVVLTAVGAAAAVFATPNSDRSVSEGQVE